METTTLGQAAISIAITAAIQWLKVHDYKADPDALTECIRANCKIRISKALHDAQEAFDCGMNDVGEAIFRAEMVLAGIDAAKEAFIVPKDHPCYIVNVGQFVNEDGITTV